MLARCIFLVSVLLFLTIIASPLTISTTFPVNSLSLAGITGPEDTKSFQSFNFFCFASADAVRYFSPPPVTQASDQSTHFASPSLSNASAMLPLGCTILPT